MNDNAAIIRAVGVDKVVEFGGRQLQILRGVRLTITRGESVAIVGVSGSGKSTLLGLLAGLDLPSAGAIYTAGCEITAMDEDQRAEVRAHNVGFVFQSFHLLPNLTALENVMLPLEILHNKKVNNKNLFHKNSPTKNAHNKNTRDDAYARAQTALARVELTHRAAHYPKQLSGGEQQRVALARAFAPSPAILFADEPTGNLDNKTGARVAELLFDMNTEHQTTLVLVTHNRDLARRCRRIITMDGGTIFERGDANN